MYLHTLSFSSAPIKCVSSSHALMLSDLESPSYSDAGLEQRFPNAVNIHPRPDSYDLRYRKRSRTISSVSSVDEDCDDDDRDSTGLYVQSPASFSSQGSNWQNDVDSGKSLSLAYGAMMSRIERTYCVIGTSYLARLFNVCILPHI